MKALRRILAPAMPVAGSTRWPRPASASGARAGTPSVLYRLPPRRPLGLRACSWASTICCPIAGVVEWAATKRTSPVLYPAKPLHPADLLPPIFPCELKALLSVPADAVRSVRALVAELGAKFGLASILQKRTARNQCKKQSGNYYMLRFHHLLDPFLSRRPFNPGT